MCGFDPACIENAITRTMNALERRSGNDFAAMERTLAREANRTPNGTIEREEIDVLVTRSRAANFMTHGQIAGRIMDEFDADRSGGITAQEWMARRSRR